MARESSNYVCLLLYHSRILAEVLDGNEGHCFEVLDQVVVRDGLHEIDVVEVIVENDAISLLEERGRGTKKNKGMTFRCPVLADEPDPPAGRAATLERRATDRQTVKKQILPIKLPKPCTATASLPQ